MPPKQKTPAPIDRPLSRAYLREFGGWSTAYPPGVSDPTTLRQMENILITRAGAARIRPGLRMLTRKGSPSTQPLDASLKIVGTHENFYLNDGRKAYLFAVRVSGGAIEFRVGIENVTTGNIDVKLLTDAGIAFDTSGWSAGAGPGFTAGTTYVKYVQIDNKILALSNNGEPLITFFVGATKRVPFMSEVPMDFHAVTGPKPMMFVPLPDWINGDKSVRPSTMSSDGEGSLMNYASGAYNLAALFTFSNELGESKPSQMTLRRLNRSIGNWRQEETDGSVGYTRPQGAPQPNVDQSADQMVFIWQGTTDQWNAAVAAGATKLNLYLMMWSTQSSVPVELNLYNSVDIHPGSTPDNTFCRLLPGMYPLDASIPIPTEDNRFDTTAPPRAGQGLVAADRLVLVYDPTQAAVIRWTTNQQGNYLNFSANRGGGRKTLTSGNMQVPASVKLWQNPQSADTITIMNAGTDGHSTSYYMAPATVTSQSDNTNVMGFEETTATPGTVSPYGNEVANNALYHPLDDQLMKSTASNYNINHKSQTDAIVNMWVPLVGKTKIVSCFFDQRLYYLVHNPRGAALEAGCNGNEVWVLDLSNTDATWSRWLTQGVSLRKVMSKGRVYLGLTRPDGIYAFDENLGLDQYVAAGSPTVISERAIPWAMETNTQGANRAHDAWAHLQTVQLTVGDFSGSLRFGVRGQDQHGTKIEKALKMRDLNARSDLPFDIDGVLEVKRDMKEWFFFAHSLEEDGAVLPSFGQISLVQYRYAPVSVNIGYEWGSIETFEYARASVNWADRTTDNGTPQPYLDMGRP